MAEDVLVIGAGPAGIACAYHLEQAGISYKVVDKAEVIASTWADQYPTLHLNTSRFYSHMPGQRFPLYYGIFATARQYHDYLLDYVARHDFNIHLGIEIQRVTPKDGGWQVETSGGVDWYPAVILATGRFPKPYQPALPGLEKFTGRVLHSQAFKGAADFADQRVMVVGNGPSGVDLVVALPEAAHLPVYLAQRTGIVLRPRYPYGLPKHLWMLLAQKLPNRLTRWLERTALGARYHDIDRDGIKVPGAGQESGGAGTRGPELLHAVRCGAVKPVDAPVDFDEDEVWLADGSRAEIDALILATGFRPALDYLDIDYDTDDQGLPRRVEVDFPIYEGYTPHTGYEVEGHLGLYVIGVFYQGRGAMYNFNVEAHIITQQIQQRLAALSQELGMEAGPVES